MTTTPATAEAPTGTTTRTAAASSDASKRWARLDAVDHYLLQAVCTMEKVMFRSGGGILASAGRLTARPHAYEDLVREGVVLLVPVDEQTVRDEDQQLDTHRVMATALGTRIVRAAHAGKWLHTAEWRS